MEDPQVFVDMPDRKQKHPHYEHRGYKLYKRNNEFTNKKLQRIRRVSNKKKLIESFERIGRCLNNADLDTIPKEGLQNVCLILINNYKHDKHDPKVGPLNDGYLIGLHHHRLGFRVFYLHNCDCQQYPKVLEFFLKYTLSHLTVFYSGRNSIVSGSNGVEFKDSSISCNEFGKIINDNYNGRCKAVFISDSCAGGSVFNIKPVIERLPQSDIISISVSKITDPDSKEGRRSHGILSYYLCKILYEAPNITPKRLSERMNASLRRFNETFVCEVSNINAENQPMFK